MATSFEDIYCLNSVIKSDKRLIDKPDYELYSLSWKYLELAIPFFQYDCLKDLTDYVPFSLTEYTFTGNGLDNIFTLNPAPTITNPTFFISKTIACGSPTISIVNYTWDSENNTITLTGDIPEQGSTIQIFSYTVGYFNADLNLDEKRILAEAMNIPYLEEAKNNRDILKFLIYGGSVKMHSQAEQEKVLLQALESQINKVEGMVSNYSYRTAPNGYVGLGAWTNGIISY